MELFLKAVACVLITAVLYLVLSKKEKDVAAVLSMGACCMILMVALQYLDEVVSFLYQLQRMVDLDEDLLLILLKSVGICILAQIAELVCADSGNAALGKTLHLLASTVILFLSLPLMNGLLELIGKVLGDR